MEETTYNLGELCKLTDVTARTVHYYIAEGLLTPPIGVKSQSRYNYEHLLRLQLIAYLKKKHFNLRNIKSLLEGKALADLMDLQQQFRLSSSALQLSDTASPALTDFKENELRLSLTKPINTGLPVLQFRQAINSPTQLSQVPELHQPKPTVSGSGFFSPKNPPPIIDEDEPETQTAPNLWERVVIAPGIELNLEKSIADLHRNDLEGLMREIARRLNK